jgi:bacteriorhodopsin
MPTTTIASLQVPLPTETRIVKIGWFNRLNHLQPMMLTKTIPGESGHYAQWITCVVFVLATIGIAIHSTFVHRKSRAFHFIASLQFAIGALSYYAMATGSGIIYAHSGIEHHHGSGGDYDVIIIRQIFYSHFIEWFCNGPLILLIVALLAGLSWSDTLTVIILDELMVLCCLTGGVNPTSWCVFKLVFYVRFQLKMRAGS